MKKNEKELINKFENKSKKETFEQKKEMYIKQIDKNYKDGDKN